MIAKISTSECATPAVAVPKKDGMIRLCGDYKVTINQAIDVDQYPLLVPEILLTTLSGGHRWKLSKECATVFQAAKGVVGSSSVLVHYNPFLPLWTAGDASAYGVGAVISHNYV